jgi:hypothetical protein
MPTKRKYELPAGKTLRGINLELFDKSSDPTISELFKSEEAAQEFDAFCKKYNIFVDRSKIPEREWIELTGSHADLMKFFYEYLSGDPPGGVYDLVFEES